MHAVVNRAQLSPNVTRLVIEAPRIAEIRQPGQFVIVHRAPGAERIPLTIADADPQRGTITLVIQAVGKSTEDLVALQVGDAIADVAGPLGRATELLDHGRAVCVGGGVGTAVVHPIALGLAARGVEVISVIGGRSKEWVIYRRRAAACRRGDRLHRRRELREARLRHGRAARGDRGGRRGRRVRRRTGPHDAGGRRADPPVRRPDASPRSTRSCWTGPGCAAAAAWRSAARPSTHAWTGPSSTRTRSTSASSPIAWARTGTSRRAPWRSPTAATPPGGGRQPGGRRRCLIPGLASTAEAQEAVEAAGKRA